MYACVNVCTCMHVCACLYWEVGWGCLMTNLCIILYILLISGVLMWVVFYWSMKCMRYGSFEKGRCNISLLLSLSGGDRFIADNSSLVGRITGFQEVKFAYTSMMPRHKILIMITN